MALYKLTKEDVEVIKKSKSSPNIFFAHFFLKKGAKRPFQLDYNFVEGKEWQVDFCMTSARLIVAICGISTGKTLAVGLSAAYMAVMFRSFKFMNIANDLSQSAIMYQLILDMAKDTLFEKLIVASPRSPNPQIKIGFEHNGIEMFSVLDFKSTGEQGEATNVMSYRGDWINIEEAGLIPKLGIVVANVVTRLTGASPEGRPYLGRLSLIANPNDNEALWEVFDMATEMDDGLTFQVNTEDNANTTPAQVALAARLIGADSTDKYLTGKRPKGEGKYFATSSIANAESDAMTEELSLLIDGYDGIPHTRADNLGLIHWEIPPKKGHVYMLFGDPGVKNAPKRDSPVLGIFDVTMAPTIAPMVAFWWGNGHGKIKPFNDTLIDWIVKYAPIDAGVDSTATQKNTAEVTTLAYLHGKGYSVNALTPMDFSGSRKFAYLISLRLSLEVGMIQYPSVADGISAQLRRYDPRLDTEGRKFPQDVVSMLSMAAYGIRSVFYDFSQHSEDVVDKIRRIDRGNRRFSSRSRLRNPGAR